MALSPSEDKNAARSRGAKVITIERSFDCLYATSVGNVNNWYSISSRLVFRFSPAGVRVLVRYLFRGEVPRIPDTGRDLSVDPQRDKRIEATPAGPYIVHIVCVQKNVHKHISI